MNERIISSYRIESRQLSKSPVPLIAETLKILSQYGLSPLQEWASYYCNPANRRHAESYLLSLACRAAGDQTGILGPLIGVSQGPEDTREILTTIEQQLLGEMNDNLKQKVFTALKEDKIADAETVLVIDELLGKAVAAVRRVGIERGLANRRLKEMTEEAFDFWLKNRLQLYQLLKQEADGDIFNLLQREEVRGGVFSDELLDIAQQPIIPVIPQELAQILQAILPSEINRQINLQPPEISKPLGFLSRLNMAGSDLFRFFAGSLKEKLKAEEMQQRVMALP